MYDPHETYNPNFPEDDWQAFKTSIRTCELANKVSELINSGLVAVVRHDVLCDLNFDVKSRVDYPAPILQISYFPHWAALAIAMMTHACFEPNYEESVTRFYVSPSTNPIMYHPNIEMVWVDLNGKDRLVAQWKGTQKAEKLKQLEMFEF